jgi:hypothetical protein
MKPLALAALVLLSAAGPRAQAPPPATVILLLDITASMTLVPLPFDQRYAQVFNAFLEGLGPAHRAAVGVVANEAIFSAVTPDRGELSAAVRRLLRQPDAVRLGPSPLWDAIDAALSLAEAAGGRAAIVLFSDGKSGGNVRGVDEVIGRARRLGVSISAVVEGPGTALLARSSSALDPADAIGRLTQATGGRHLLDRPPDPRQRNPGPLVSLIMDGLRR